MTARARARRQCAKCPWKVSTNPHDIPGGYEVVRHKALASTIAGPGNVADVYRPLHIMACHETSGGRELPCVGWLVQQLGPGNNIGLRLAVMAGRVDANVQSVGPQHECLEDTLPE